MKVEASFVPRGKRATDSILEVEHRENEPQGAD
jgi:hypothetical protein